MHMLENLIQLIKQFYIFVETQILIAFASPFIPSQRIFWLYMVTSTIFALYVYYLNTKSDPNHKVSLKAFFRFLFPKYIWQSASAWLDVRYFFFHHIFRSVINGALLFGTLDITFKFITGGPDIVQISKLVSDLSSVDMVVSTLYMFGLIMFVDFVTYVTHYLQHKIPLLWEFHKVHHSLELMHPISNYREHPIDNIFYAISVGVAYGLFMGVVQLQMGYVPSMPLLLGIPVLMFAFNALGYNLRHSHVWLRWPGRWSMVFGSPAHHHIHHSYHPDQINKNFAFMFPVWDVLFRTYHLPETNKDVRFGISENHVNKFETCLGLYFIPLKDACILVSQSLKRLLKKIA